MSSGAGGHIGQGAMAVLAAGAWQRGIEGPGSVTLQQYCTITNPNPGEIRVEHNQPCAPGNFVASFCFLGSTPQNARWTCERTSDTVKTFFFRGSDGEDPVDVSFSFVFLKGPN